MLTINSVLASFNLTIEESWTQTLKGQTVEYRYFSDERDIDQYHQLSIGGEIVWCADKVHDNPVEEDKEALKLQAVLNTLGLESKDHSIKSTWDVLNGFDFIMGDGNKIAGRQATVTVVNKVLTVLIEGELVWKFDTSLTEGTNALSLERVLKDKLKEIAELNAKRNIVKQEEKELNTLNIPTSVTNNWIMQTLSAYGVEAEVNRSHLPTNMSALNASDLILTTINTVVQPSNLDTDLVFIRNTILAQIKRTGNYESSNLTQLLKTEWASVAPKLHNHPEMHKAIKSWIINMNTYSTVKSHVKLKELALEMNIQGIQILKDLV